MSHTIDNRVVQMEFENKNFESNANTSISTLDKLKQALKLDGAGGALNNAEKALGKLDLSSLSSGIGAVKDRFSLLGIIGMTAIQNITNKVIDLGMHLVNDLVIEPVSQGFQEYELKMGSVQTIMASTGASLEEVNGYLEELNLYADKTIYSFSDMTSSIGKFTNAGVKLDDAVLAIKGISNEAAVSGANANEASRAMYNFAQALSAGYVKLIDWKSIENANMATVEFKQQLIDTAVEMKTLEKTADGYYKVLTQNAQGGTMDGTISATKNFNDSLSYQWMTTDVLVKTLGRYADETTEIGKKAYAAAQDVKTFSQLMDTLKEAVGSGWSRTFEIIIGDFNQAKELFTSISKVVGGFIDRTSDSRNNFLEAVLGGDSKYLTSQLTSFADIMTQVGDRTQEFRDKLVELGKAEGIDVTALMLSYGSLEPIFNDGKISVELFNKALREINNTGTSAANKIAGTSNEFRSFSEIITRVGDRTGEFRDKLVELGKEEGVDVTAWMIRYGSLEALFNSGEVSTSLFNKALRELAKTDVGKSIDLTTKSFKTYDEIMSRVGDRTDEFKDKLVELGKEQGIDVTAWMIRYGSLEALFNSGEVSADLFNQALQAITPEPIQNLTEDLEELEEVAQRVIRGEFGNGEERIKALTEAGYDYHKAQLLVNHDLLGWSTNISELSDEQLKLVGYTEDEIKVLREQGDTLEESTETVESLAESFDGLTGRELIIKGLANTFKYLGSIIGTVKAGFDTVFDPISPVKVYKILGNFYNFSKTLKLTDDQTTNLTNTFSGLFSVVDMFKQAASAVGRVIEPYLPLLGGITDKVLTVSGAFGHFVKALADAAEQGDWFYRLFSSIADFIQDKLSSAGKVVGEFTDRFNKMFGTNIHIPSLKEITDFFANLETKVPNLDKYFLGAIDKVKQFGSNAVKEFEKITGIKLKLPTMDQVFDVIGKIKANVEKLRDFLKGQFEELKDTGIFDNIDDKLAGLVQKVKNFAGGFKKEFERVTGIKLKLPSMDQIIDVLGKIKDKAGDAIDFLKGAFEGLKNTGIFDWVKEKFESIKDAIASVLNPGGGKSGDGANNPLSGVSDALGKLPDVLSAIGKHAPGAVDGIKDFFKQFKPDFGSIVKGVSDAFTGMKDGVEGAGPVISDFFKNVGEGLGAFLSTVSFDQIADLVKTGLLLYFGIQVVSFVKSLKKAADNVADVGEVLSQGIIGIFGKKQIDTSFAAQFLKIAAGLAIIALAIVDLSRLPIPSIVKGGAALAIVLGVVAVVMGAMDKVAKLNGSNIAGIGIGFLGLSAAMLVLAGAIVVWSKIPVTKIVVAGLEILAFIGILSAIMKYLNTDGKNMAAMSASFILLSVAMLALAGAMLVFSKIPIDVMIDSLGPLIIFIAALSAAMSNYGTDGKNMAIMAVGLLALAAAMVVLAGACLLFSQFSLPQLVDGLGPMLIFVGLLGVIIQNFPTDKILAVAGGMLALSVSMIALTASLMSLSLMNPEHLGVALIALAGGLIAMAAAAAIVSGVTAGAVAMVVMAGAVLALTVALTALSNVGLGDIAKLLLVLALAVGALAAAAFLLAPASVSLVGIGVAFAGVGVGAYFLTEALLNLGDIITGLVGTIGSVLDWIVNAVGGVIDWAKGAIDGVAGVLQFLGIIGKDSGEQLTQNLASSIETGTPDVLSAAQNTGDQAMSTLNQSLEAGGANTAATANAIGWTNFIDPLCGALTQGTTNVNQSTDSLMNSMLGTMGGFSGDFSSTGLGLMDSFNGSILEGGGVVDLSTLGISEDMLSNLTVDGSGTGYDDIMSFVTGVQSGEGDVASAGSGIADILGTNLVRNCSSQGAGNVTTYNSGILSKKGATKSAGDTVGSMSVAGFGAGSSGSYSTGAGAGGRYCSGILSQKGAANSAGSSMASGAVSGANSQSGGFYNAGSGAGNGFINGLRATIGNVVSAAADFGRRALAALKARIDSHSPSKEFAKLGVFSGEGYALGMRKSTGKAIRASEGMAEKSLGAMKHALSKIAASITDDIDLTPTISPVLDLSEIQNGSKKIQGILGQQDVTLNPTGMTRNNLNDISMGMNNSGFDVVTAINDLRTDVSKLSAAISADRDRDTVLYTNIHTTMDGREIASTLTDSVVKRINRSQVAKLKAVGA